MDRILNNINATATIRSKLPQIIDAFVMFYGEENRDLITEKLNNTIIVGYYDTSSLFSLIYTEEKKVTNEICEDIFTKLGIEFNDENREKYFGTNYSFGYPNLITTVNAARYIEQLKKSPEELLLEEKQKKHEMLTRYLPELSFEDFVNRNISVEQIKTLPGYVRKNLDSYYDFDIEGSLKNMERMCMADLKKIHPSVSEANVDELVKTGQLDYILDMNQVFKEGLEKYNDFYDQNLKKVKEYYEKVKEYEKDLETKYYIDFLMEFKEYLRPEDVEKIEKAVQEGNFRLIDFNDLTDTFGYSLSGQKSISYFDEKSDKKLANPNTQDYDRETIERNRVKYFKYRGIDFGDNYENYVNNPVCKSMWPTYEEVDKFEERADYYQNEYNVERYTHNDFYIQTLEEAKKAGLLDKDDIISPETISHRMTCVYPNMYEKDGEYVLCPVVAIHTDGEKEADVRLIHELNHVIELALIEVKDNAYRCVCGWDYLDGKINQDEVTFGDTVHRDETKRGYELLSEIMNELLAQGVTKMMHENDVFILTDKDHYKDYGGTTYEWSLFLVRDFFNTYLEDIIASRKNNNIEVIFNKVGKDNFDKMNDLFHEFYEYYPEPEFYKLMSDLKENKDTERVQRFNSLKARRDEVLAAMQEYSKSSQVTL